MKRPFAELGDLIKAGLEMTGLKGAVREKTALQIWSEVVGENTASVTRAEKINQGVLYVTCKDSVWAQELHFLRPIILKKMNERLGAEIVKEIRLSGRGFPKGAASKDEKPDTSKQKEAPKLSTDEIEEIKHVVQEEITNEDLAERLARSLQASRRLRKKFEE